MKTITFNRYTLYKEIWKIPKNKLAEQYGLTHHQITKVCKELNIPSPRSGHWSSVRNGTVVKPGPLPQSEIENYELKVFQEPGTDIDLNQKLPKGFREIKMKKYLRNPHRLVKKTYNYLRDDHWPDSYGRVQTYGNDLLGVSVTPETLNRAMRFLDALITELERQGFEIGTECDYKLSSTYVIFGEDRVYFNIQEEGKFNRKKHNPDTVSPWKKYDNEYYTTGRLRLRISDSIHMYKPVMIKDKKNVQIEDQFEFILRTMFLTAKKAKERRLARIEADRKAEEWRQAWERKERERRKEMKFRDELEEQSALFTKSHYIYQFIQEVEIQIKQNDLDQEQLARFFKWKKWATDHADRLNPVKQKIDSILNPVEEEESKLYLW